MPPKAKTPAGTKRDVTRALAIARELALQVEPLLGPRVQELTEILQAIDARSGRRDPSVRKRKAAK